MRGPLLAVTGALTGLGVVGIKAASDLEQSIGAVESIFKDSADQILEFGENSANALGLSQRAFNEAVVPLGAMMKNAGVAVDDVADRMIELTHVAADMAATHGGTVKEAMDALGAAFRGEADPIERFGLSLKITDINARAVALGLAEQTSAVDSTARATAFMNLVMEQTADIQGQAVRESGTVASRLQQVTARFEDLRAELGENLLPIAEKVLGWINTALTWFSNLPKPLQDGTVAVLGLVGALALIGLVIGPIATVVGLIGGIGLLIAAAVAVAVGAIIYFWNTNKGFRDFIIAAWEKIKEVVANAVEAIRGWWERNRDDIIATAEQIWDRVKDVFAAGVELVKVVLGHLKSFWDTWGNNIIAAGKIMWEFFVDNLEVAWEFIKGIFVATLDTIEGAIKVITGLLTGDWALAWEGAKLMLKGFGNAAITIANAVIGAFEAMVNAIAKAINGIPEINLPFGQKITLPEIPELSLPRIPMLAEGGIVTKPTLAMIGESGPEAVVPLDRGGMGGDTYNYHFTINNPQMDSPARVEQLADAMQRRTWRTNRRGINVGAVA